MNKEEAIEYLKNLIKNPTISQDPFHTTKIAIDTVLNYIEALKTTIKTKDVLIKKTNLEAQKYFDMLMEVEYGRDTIPKQKVRDKIEELEEKSKKYQEMQGLRYSEIALDVARIQVLKELLKENK